MVGRKRASKSLDPEVVGQVADVLVGARSALFVTGAGISAASGLPTYRGVGGLYDRRDTENGMSIEEALSGRTMRADPALSWKYISGIEAACRGARPNRGHRVIAALEERMERVWVLTQNVDGLHHAAGSSQVIEIHGRVHSLICTRCPWGEEVADYSDLSLPPSCPACGEVVRPDVVLFGERLPSRSVSRMVRELEHGFDVVFSVGTTSVFPYIAEPVRRARWSGRPSVEINPSSTAVSELVTHRLRAGAAEALGAVWEAYLERSG